MIKFLFWNIHRQPVEHLVMNLAIEHKVDVLILVECTFPLPAFLRKLNASTSRKYCQPFSPVVDPVIITRFPRGSIRVIRDSAGVSLRSLTPPVGPDILLGALHLASKLHQKESDQAFNCSRTARIIREEEQKIGHRRTLIVGDFNMNPFESGVVAAEGLHGVMSRRIAEEEKRVVAGEERYFFYNPMWNHFGDYPKAPAGTYFFRESKQVTYFWNMFDQLMLRPELLDYFDESTLRILTYAGTTNLLDRKGVPNKNEASDHLPVVFGLNLYKRSMKHGNRKPLG